MSFYSDSTITANIHQETLWIDAVDAKHDQSATLYINETQAHVIHAIISARYPQFLDPVREQVRAEMEAKDEAVPQEPVPIPTSDLPDKKKD